MFKNNIRHHYRDIERGCSFCIPIVVKDEDDKGIDLSEYKANFTLKRTPFDFDRYDEKAFISKTIDLTDATDGEFKILLSSEELDLPPGPYFFDLILIHKTTNLSVRIICCDFNLVGGPGNRHVSPATGATLINSPGIQINLISGPPFIVYAPFFNEADLADIKQRLKDIEEKLPFFATKAKMTVSEWLTATEKADLTDITDDVYDGTDTSNMNIQDGRT